MILHRSFQEDLVRILMKSFKRSLYDLVRILARRSGGDPDKVLPQRFLHGDLEDDLH